MVDTSIYEHALIIRERISNKINRSLRSHKWVFVSAPGGYGKTIAVAQSLNAIKYDQKVWLEIKKSHNYKALFYQHFAKSIFKLKNLKTCADVYNIDSMDALLSKMQKMAPTRYIGNLVIDNLHFLTNQEIISTLPLLLQNLPKGIFPLLISRTPIPQPLEAFFKSEQGVVITADELLFSKTEIHELYQEHGITLKKAEINALYKKTGGWPLGLKTILLHSKQTTNGPNEIQSNLLDQYLDKYIWPYWSLATQKFMLSCCLTEEFSPALCQHLTGRNDSKEFLLTLKKQGVFIQEKKDDVYCFYDHFRQYLLNLFETDLAEKDKFMFRRKLGEWFFANSDFYGALKHFLAAGFNADINKCMHKINDFNNNQSVCDLLDFAEVFTGIACENALLEKNPYILEKRPLIAFLKGDVKGYFYWLKVFNAQLPRIVRQYPDLAETSLFLKSLDFRRPLHEIAQTFIKEYISLLAKQKKQPAKKVKIGSITQNLPYFHRSMRDYSSYNELKEEELTILRNTIGRFIGEDYPALEHCLQGGILYEQNHLLDALHHALSARAIIQKTNCGAETYFSVQMLLFIIFEALGNDNQVNVIFQETEAGLNAKKASFLMSNLRAVRIKWQIEKGDMAAAYEWLHYFAPETRRLQDNLTFYRLPCHFTSLSALKANANWNMAFNFGEKLLDLAKNYQRPLDILQTILELAYITEKLKGQKNANLLWLKALKFGYRFRYTRQFINAGNSALQAISKLTLEDKSELKKFCELILTQAGYKTPFPTTYNLTRQMQVILKELKKGGTYNDIAQRTGLKKSSVKTHIVRLYRVLNVSSKKEALEKAVFLKLME